MLLHLTLPTLLSFQPIRSKFSQSEAACGPLRIYDIARAKSRDIDITRRCLTSPARMPHRHKILSLHPPAHFSRVGCFSVFDTVDGPIAPLNRNCPIMHLKFPRTKPSLYSAPLCITECMHPIKCTLVHSLGKACPPQADKAPHGYAPFFLRSFKTRKMFYEIRKFCIHITKNVRKPV